MVKGNTKSALFCLGTYWKTTNMFATVSCYYGLAFAHLCKLHLSRTYLRDVLVLPSEPKSIAVRTEAMHYI
jgi:hypothetical protein